MTKNEENKEKKQPIDLDVKYVKYSEYKELFEHHQRFVELYNTSVKQINDFIKRHEEFMKLQNELNMGVNRSLDQLHAVLTLMVDKK